MSKAKLTYSISSLLLSLLYSASAQTTRVDHVLIAVANLDSAKAEYEGLGFSVVYGGTKKEALNALIFLRDGTLIELIGKDRFPDYYSLLNGTGVTRLLGLMKDRISRFGKAPAGLFNYCLYSRDLDSTYSHLKKNGIKCNKPVRLKRKREDGIITTWSLVGTAPYDLPFFINDYNPPRVSDSTLQNHANGALGIDSLEVITDDFDLYVNLYSIFYDKPSHITGNNGSRKARYALSHQSLILSETIDPITLFKKKKHSVPAKVYLKNVNTVHLKPLNRYLYL